MRPEPLAAIGLSFREAPAAMRARVASALPEASVEALRAQGVTGVVEIHTCARSLWLVASENPVWAAALVQSHVASRLGGEVLPVTFAGEDAFRHALRVAVGLESFVEGEGDVGNQVADAFGSALTTGRSCAVLNHLHQSAARLVAEGRSAGFVRPGKGLGPLAVAALQRAGVGKDARVAVVGAGAIGLRTRDALRRAAYTGVTVHNRSPRPECEPLEALRDRDYDAVVVCTAGPEGWLSLAAPVVIDLGVPRQVAGEAIGLDDLLRGAGMRLGAERRAQAEAALERELAELLARVRGLRARRSIGRTVELRDRFVASELEAAMAGAVGDLSPTQRRRVMEAARGAIRQYNHAVVTWLREEEG